MKNRDLIILFVVFGIVILFSLLITQQSQKVVSLSEKEITVIGQAENIAPMAYSAQVSSLPMETLPLARSGVTIIATPSIESEKKPLQVSEIASKGANSIIASNADSNVEEPEVPRPAGITEIGKRPTPKEAKEMNSSGIVMY
jgi:hypothetical protein